MITGIGVIALMVVMLSIGIGEERIKDLYGYDNYNDNIDII